MTYEEAKKQLRKMKPIGAVCAEAIDVAIEALEKADKYRWHDLKENTKDLPPEGKWVFTQGVKGATFICKLEDGTFIQKGTRVIMPNVRAWKDIDVFVGKR